MKLYFHFAVHEPLFHQVARKLRADHGVDSIGGIVWGRDQAEFLQGTAFPWWRLDVVTAWLGDLGTAKPDMSYLAEAERRYGLPTLARMVFGERHLVKRYDHDDLLRIIELALRRFERLFDEDRPDAIFVTSVDGLITMLLYAVAKSRGVPLIHLDTGRIERRAAITHDHLMTWTDVDAAFEARRSQPLSTEARARAETFLADFRERKTRIQAPRAWMFPTPRLDDLRRLVASWRSHGRDPLNPVLLTPLEMVRQKASRLFNDRMSRWQGLFEEPVPGERYVLFPLHYQPEVSTLVMGTYYLDQAALIEDIAKSLPIGHRLYVKEHFFSIGRRPLAEYRRIKKCFNVRLVGALNNPIEMVMKADAVATISGTMGWESILLEKPTITFGDCFYNAYPQVYRAGLVPKVEWTRVFSDALTKHRPDRELLLKYVSAILDTTYEGHFSFDHPLVDPERSMTEENFQNIAGVIARELRAVARPAIKQGAA